MSKSSNRRGPALRCFSIIELLVVFAIISMLAAVLLPTLSTVKERSKRLQCASNIRQIGLAVEYYKADNGRYFPVKPPTSINYWNHVGTMNILGSNYLESNFGVFQCPSNKNRQGDPYRSNSLGRMDYEINSGFFGIHIRGLINGELGGIGNPSLALLIYEWPDPETLGYSPTDAPHFDGGFNGFFVDGHAEWITLTQAQESRGGFSPYWKWGR